MGIRALAGNLGLGLISAALLVVWMVMLTIFVPVLKFAGLSTTLSAGIISILFFILYWVVGLDYIFDLGIVTNTSDD